MKIISFQADDDLLKILEELKIRESRPNTSDLVRYVLRQRLAFLLKKEAIPKQEEQQ